MKTGINKERICIIGGGASGISVGKSLFQAGIESFDIFEQEDDFGGNWYFGKDCANVYESAHLISSKLQTEFSDFPAPEDLPPFPNHEQFLSYLRSVAKHFNLYEKTTFNTSVVRVVRKNKAWKVVLSSGEEKLYTSLIVANGRLQEPIFPNIPGSFSGETIHSKYYRRADIFRGKKVLVVGGGNSGCDISVDAAYFAAKTFHSTRRPYYYLPKFIDGKTYQEWMIEKAKEFKSTKEFWDYAKKIFKQSGYDPTDFGLPAPDYEIDQTHPIVNAQILYHIGHGSILPKPDIEKYEGNQVHFTDNSVEEIDLVVYATGYKMAFPFLADALVEWQNGMPNYFMHTVHRTLDNLFFFGYLNTASGFGNIANTAGRFLTSYLKAKACDSEGYHIFQKLKQGPNPNLGQDYFLKTPRHNCEVEMWKFLKTMNFLADKLAT